MPMRPFLGAETILDKAHALMPPSPLSPRWTRVSGPNSSLHANAHPTSARIGCEWYYPDDRDDRAVVPISALGLGWSERTSANFGTFRTATTIVTSVAASELYRGDLSSMALSVSESSYRDNESSAGGQCHPYSKLVSNMRDRKLSEVENYDLTRGGGRGRGGDFVY